MVRCTNGVMTLRVTRQAFLDQYQPCGFTLLESSENVEGEELYSNSPEAEFERRGDSTQEEEDEGAEAEEGEAEEAEEEYTEDEEVDLSEIPLTEMDYYQLCEYADQLGLDRKGLRSKKELRQLIRQGK